MSVDVFIDRLSRAFEVAVIVQDHHPVPHELRE